MGGDAIRTERNLAIAEVVGSVAEELDKTPSQVDEASRVDLGFPHDFLSGARGFVYGDVLDRIDSHPHRG